MHNLLDAFPHPRPAAVGLKERQICHQGKTDLQFLESDVKHFHIVLLETNFYKLF
jgi:hypothetical protein